MTTGELIRNIRKAKGVTQKQLGELAGIAEPTIRSYESGRLNPKIGTIEKIANALGVSTVSLLPEESLVSLEVSSRYMKAEYAGAFDSYKTDSLRDQILSCYDQLNKAGQEKAVERVEELTEIPKYQKESPPEE